MTGDVALWLAVGGLAVLCVVLLLTTTRARRAWAHERSRARAEMAELLAAKGLPAAGGLQEQILALHQLLALSPSRVLLASLGDAVGDLRQPNMPGTVDEYPNWRLPVADGQGRMLSRAELCAAPGAAELARALAAAPPADRGVVTKSYDKKQESP